jgi:hypothetical protein
VDELEIQGKKYISSKRASELTGYAKDYVGQLARAGKVPGTRVGRAWYVDEATILSLAGPTNATQSDFSGSQADTMYSIHALNHKRGQSAFGTWSSVSYFEDSDPLMPPLFTIAESQVRTEKTSKTLVFPGIMRGTPVDGVVRFSNNPVAISPLPKSESRLGYVFGTLVLIAIVLVLVGSFNSSQWAFDASSSLAAVQNSSTGNAFGDYFSSLSTQGADLINDFLGQILSSFWSFFNSGLIFILRLLHLG